MTLDLVGKLHRTVYIVGCPGDASEDLAQLMLRRCGAIEAWDVEEQQDDKKDDVTEARASTDQQRRVTIVFQSVNSIGNALTFNGLSFLDLNSKLIVWRANDAPPHSLQRRQLTIDSVQKNDKKSNSTDKSCGLNDTDSSSAAAHDDENQQNQEQIRRRDERAARRAALQSALGLGNKNDAVLNYTRSSAARGDKLRELCYRQLKALCALTAAAVERAEEQLSELQQQIQIRQSLLSSAAPSASTTTSRVNAAAAAPVDTDASATCAQVDSSCSISSSSHAEAITGTQSKGKRDVADSMSLECNGGADEGLTEVALCAPRKISTSSRASPVKKRTRTT